MAMKAFSALVLALFVVSANGQALSQNAQDFVSALTSTSNAQFSTLQTAVGAANLTSAIQGLANSTNGVTVFAPTNAAFSALGSSVLNCLTAPTGLSLLGAILSYHVVPQNLPAATVLQAAQNGTTVTTVRNQTIAVTIVNNTVVLNGNTTVTGANNFTNGAGTIHAINAVLIPPGGLAAVAALCASPPTTAPALTPTGAIAPAPVARTPTPTAPTPAGSFSQIAPGPSPSSASGLSAAVGLVLASAAAVLAL